MAVKHPKTTSAWMCSRSVQLWLALVASACLVDLDDRCGDNQRYDADNANCVCDGDFELQGNECVACAENEVGSPSGCACAEGFARATPEAACEPLAGLGQDCGDDGECGDERYPHCQIEADAEVGYCTASDCSSADDCPSDYGCNSRQAPSYCERPPEGLGRACESSDECEATAPYCETVVAKSCVVNDCAPDPSRCHGDWVCCDIALLTQSLCIPPSELEEGACPAGGTLVPREEP
jgi:hypothetical protein